MFPHVFLFVILRLLANGNASPVPSSTIPSLDTTGFIRPSISYSTGGNAICVSGLIDVTASTDHNVELNLPSNFNQTYATELVLELNSANSTLVQSVTGSEQHIEETYHISAQLCSPSNATGQNFTTVQFLTHGIGFAKSYWDFASPDNSYIDAAAIAGHVTFGYDRLGVGESSHPDPIQVVQGPLQVSIAHELVALLRKGSIANQKFARVIGVGHSYGSAISATAAGSYPADFDAVVLTGYSPTPTGGSQFVASLNLEIAADSPSERFPGFASGYLLPSTLYGVQYAFFRYPDFTQKLLAESFARVETTTVGEQFTMSLIEQPEGNFTGPVYVVNGEHDLVFCDGDCLYPDDITAATVKGVFPNANGSLSGSFNLPRSGHGLNLAANAPVAFERILRFVESLGY